MAALLGTDMKAKTEKYVKNTLIPSILLGITISTLSALLYILRNELIIISESKFLIFASFGSTAFIMFLMPSSPSARIDKFVKSYTIAAVIGLFGFYAYPVLGIFFDLAIIETLIALALVSARAMHPPAAAIGIVFAIGRIGLYGVAVIALGILTIVVLRIVLDKIVMVTEEELSKNHKDAL
ncbi:MAG: HPP family protein [Thermoplasmata archaeon]